MKKNQLIMDILVGKLLGDGHQKCYNNNMIITIEHSIDSHAYIQNMWENLKKENLVKIRPQLYWRYDKRYNKYNYSLHFATLPLLKNIYSDLFLFIDSKTNKKVLPSNISELLTPRALAYWIMDDGQRPSERNGKVYQGTTICTDNFTLEEISILMETLNNKYSLKVSLHKKGNNFRIYISKTSMENLRSIILEYLIPEMQYKIRI